MSSMNYSSTLLGVEAHLVGVEVVVTSGLPGLTVVGLPDAAVTEAGARIRSALKMSGVSLPPRRMVVNLAPADLRKTGSGFDLALALALSEALEEIPPGCLKNTLVVGELSLDGEVRAVRGEVSSLALAAESQGLDSLMVSAQNADSLPRWEGVKVIPVSTLGEAMAYCRGEWSPEYSKQTVSCSKRFDLNVPDLAEVQGQTLAKLALEISAAGGHHLAMIGPPGCGKSFLASCLPGLLPPMTESEEREVAAIQSVCDERFTPGRRPFRAPGCGVSTVALLGGVYPGEITRAHRGVLFLDEFPEFRRDALESLRSVLEEGEARVARARFRIRYPAHFTLVCAMNPCPCGLSGSSTQACVCSPNQVKRYQAKLSGPLADRLDMMVMLDRVPLESAGLREGESSALVAGRVERARLAQQERGALNRDLRGQALFSALRWSSSDREYAQRIAETSGQSMRAYQKWLKVARTLADLQEAKSVGRHHLLAARSVRAKESLSSAHGLPA